LDVPQVEAAKQISDRPKADKTQKKFRWELKTE
jgi:hypothetical protein